MAAQRWLGFNEAEFQESLTSSSEVASPVRWSDELSILLVGILALVTVLTVMVYLSMPKTHQVRKKIERLDPPKEGGE